MTPFIALFLASDLGGSFAAYAGTTAAFGIVAGLACSLSVMLGLGSREPVPGRTDCVVKMGDES